MPRRLTAGKAAQRAAPMVPSWVPNCNLEARLPDQARHGVERLHTGRWCAAGPPSDRRSVHRAALCPGERWIGTVEAAAAGLDMRAGCSPAAAGLPRAPPADVLAEDTWHAGSNRAALLDGNRCLGLKGHLVTNWRFGPGSPPPPPLAATAATAAAASHQPCLPLLVCTAGSRRGPGGLVGPGRWHRQCGRHQFHFNPPVGPW